MLDGQTDMAGEPSGRAALPITQCVEETSPPASKATVAASIPAEVETPFGIVNIKRVTEGQYALRHAVNEDLAELIRRTVQERGRWQPRYRNWLVAAEHITAIAADLRTGSPS